MTDPVVTEANAQRDEVRKIIIAVLEPAIKGGIAINRASQVMERLAKAGWSIVPAAAEARATTLAGQVAELREVIKSARYALVALHPVLNATTTDFPGIKQRRAVYFHALGSINALAATDPATDPATASAEPSHLAPNPSDPGVTLARDAVLAIIARWLKPDHVRLSGGEHTAQEMRSVLAATGAIDRQIRALPVMSSQATIRARKFINRSPDDD